MKLFQSPVGRPNALSSPRPPASAPGNQSESFASSFCRFHDVLSQSSQQPVQQRQHDDLSLHMIQPIRTTSCSATAVASALLSDVAAPSAITAATSFASSSSPSTAAVRCVLLGWLSEVADWLQLGGPTLVAGVRLLDAFLERQSLRPPDSLLQLLALTCLAEATRAGEPHIRPSLHEWASLAVNPATGEPLYEVFDFIRMERLVLEALRTPDDGNSATATNNNINNNNATMVISTSFGPGQGPNDSP
ncbi:hypothetical protein Agub_g8302 [Astrephomene gubernaculifera]|uniref:Cyclin N-terminal domain-containing protein n=1 Tax=Astrephomene gubernaculifera TaxID=47775 RepID=A0AAD3HMB9_9CHLO|nr:hypothetical protein Agub_g8302 [Astrephomene gubernaculifera]